MHWFTADPHYGHHRILDFCKRPFPDTATMNARLLEECRRRVGPDDDLWIIGDFSAVRRSCLQVTSRACRTPNCCTSLPFRRIWASVRLTS